MKSLKVGYSLVIVVLLTLTITLGIAAFYSAPKRYDYPQYPTSTGIDFNSPEYKQQQQKYNEDLKNYQQKNKDVEEQRKIWGQNAFIICLIAAIAMFIVGAFLFEVTYFLSVSLFFAAFTLMWVGPSLASYYAENTPIPFIGGSSQTDLTRYKQIQFVITALGSVIGAALSFLLRSKDHSS